MPEGMIRTRETRYRDDYSSDDERSSYGRSRHGGGGGGGYKTVQRYRVTARGSLPVEEIEDDRRSVRTERLDVGTRSNHLEIDRRVEREERIERPRSALEYREPERNREVKRTIVYERERERDRSPESSVARGWDRERDRGFEREKETEIKVERRRGDREESPVEMERYTREVDYYAPADAPQRTIVIRRRSPERERERERDRFAEAAVAGAGAYEFVRREQVIDNREMVPRRQQEDFYFNKREVREVEPRRDEVALRERRDRRSTSDRSDSGSEVIVRKKVVKERERSRSPRHKLHLAEGALAGAGAAAILANHRDKTTGTGHERRGRKILAGAALGTLGAELATRARSRIRSREASRERSESRSRSRSSSRGGHRKLKTGLALAATALATAAAAKYISNRNDRKEEIARGRSRTRSVSRRRRYSSDDPAITRHTDPKHRAVTAAKAGAAAAAVAGVVEHFRNKSKGRSKSRLRTGGIVAATGLAGAAVAGLYEARKAKQDADDEALRGRNHTARSLSRPRSVGAYSDPVVDPEMGMVEYGGYPVYSDPAAAAAERSRERRRSRSRSKSKVRDLATGALATGAAAIGIDRYKKRKERKEAERERRRYEEESPPVDNYYANQSYDDGYSSSPPHMSGGAHYPEVNAPPAGFAPNAPYAAPYGHDYPAQAPYDPAHNPAYYPASVVPPPPAVPVDPYTYPAPRETGNGGHVSSPMLFAPQAKAPPSRNMYNMTDEEGRLIPPSPESVSSAAATISTPDDQPQNKSVTFAPLSPGSARRLGKRRNSDPSSDRPITPKHHRRHHRRASRSPSPITSDVTEVLPDRFDKNGRPLDEDGYPFPQQQPEMVERIVHEFEDVLEGRQSWKGLLRGLFEQVDESGGRRRR